MNRLLVILLILLPCTLVSGQTKTPPAPKRQPESLRREDPEIVQRRSAALSLLESLAIEARSYRDEPLRARVQARVADVLWDHDQANARNLFRRAWEVAEEVESRSAEMSNSMIGRRQRSQPMRPVSGLRAEILKLAARRDRELGEEFLARMTGKKTDATSESASKSSPESEVSEQQAAERLRLANDFLDSGDVQRGLQYADPALTRITRPAIQFLVALRARDASAADKRFAALLSLAGNDPASDANTVSLLTTYAFTPSVYVAVSSTGIPSSLYSEPLPPPDLSPALRAAYFRVAANILLRPFAQIDQSTAGRLGTHFIATRLLPLFQQYAPELAPALSSQLASLGPEAAATTRNGGDWLNRGLKPPDPGGDEIGGELEDRLSRAKTADARDRVYALAAMRAADNGDPRAREWTEKIEDMDTRNGLRSFVDYNFVLGLLRKKRIDEAVALARKANLSPILRAHVLIRAAAAVPRSDAARAEELVEESLAVTRRIDAGAPERTYNLIAILAQLARLNKARTWELLADAIKGANANPDFTGERGHTSVKLEGKFSVELGAELMSPTDLNDIFQSLGEQDFYQAVNAAKSFTGEAPRALTTLSVASVTLKEEGNRSGKVESK